METKQLCSAVQKYSTPIKIVVGGALTLIGALALAHIGFFDKIDPNLSLALLGIGVTALVLAALSNKKWERIALAVALVGLGLLIPGMMYSNLPLIAISLGCFAAVFAKMALSIGEFCCPPQNPDNYAHLPE